MSKRKATGEFARGETQRPESDETTGRARPFCWLLALQRPLQIHQPSRIFRVGDQKRRKDEMLVVGGRREGGGKARRRPAISRRRPPSPSTSSFPLFSSSSHQDLPLQATRMSFRFPRNRDRGDSEDEGAKKRKIVRACESSFPPFLLRLSQPVFSLSWTRDNRNAIDPAITQSWNAQAQMGWAATGLVKGWKG